MKPCRIVVISSHSLLSAVSSLFILFCRLTTLRFDRQVIMNKSNLFTKGTMYNYINVLVQKWKANLNHFIAVRDLSSRRLLQNLRLSWSSFRIIGAVNLINVKFSTSHFFICTLIDGLNWMYINKVNEAKIITVLYISHTHTYVFDAYLF